MNRRVIIISLIIVLFGTQAVFAENVDTVLPKGNLYTELILSLVPYGYVEYIPLVTLAATATSDAEIPRSIRNNRYFLESVRYTNLAQQAFEEGDYDASTQYSEEAVRYAQLSDDFVRLQLKIREADDAIAAARRRLDYAATLNAATKFPFEYGQAQTAYSEARGYRAAERWDDAIAAANRVIAALAYIESDPTAPAVVTQQPAGPAMLPSQYTVRPWSVSKDCFWNIAGRPWVYNDPKKWKLLYEANKSRMPEPNNADLIHPGMVLTIPSLKGESRQGMWDAGTTYQSLP